MLYLVSDMLSDKVLNVCGKLLVVCDDLSVYWCMGLNKTELRGRCGNDGWIFLNVEGGFNRIRG